MTQIIEQIEAHYETNEVPFVRIYVWHPEHIVFECECGEQFTLFASSTTTLCWCGADHGAIIRDIQKREGRLPDKISHPWLHDAKKRAQQHLKDEAAYPEDSAWRYNDITS